MSIRSRRLCWTRTPTPPRPRAGRKSTMQAGAFAPCWPSACFSLRAGHNASHRTKRNETRRPFGGAATGP
eukprot:scaffold27852_cov58-Phaeocystis_antarctica.AAC.1